MEASYGVRGMSEREVTPPLPPRISLEDTFRPWEPRDIDTLMVSLEGARWYRELVEEFGDLKPLVEYTAKKYLAPSLVPYITRLIEVSRNASARESRVGRRFIEELRSGVTPSAVDRFVQRYLGVRPYSGVFAPLSALPGMKYAPAPPEGMVTISGPYRPGFYFADATVAETLTVRPDKRIEGPLFFTRKDHSWEVRFDGVGMGGVIVWVLWEFIFCILFRFWIPVVVWVGKTPSVMRFTMSIDYTYDTAYSIMSLAMGKEPIGVTLRKVL